MIGIIILNYQTWELSLRCMKSIPRACGKMQYRIYLVDNASESPMPEAIREFLEAEEGRCLICAASNRGYAAGNNLGIMRALDDMCEVLLVANNDIVFTVQSICRMVDCLAENPKTGIVGPKVINCCGEVQPSRCCMRTGIKEIFQLHTAVKKIFRKKQRVYACMNQDVDVPSYVYHVSGCCFAITRECAMHVMPFDEGTVLYNEELILGIRMEQAGFLTRYEPKSVVVHQHGATAEKSLPFMYRCICKSELYYCSKYLYAAKYQLWLLYQYRKQMYWFRSLVDQRLRDEWNVFKQETKKMYRNMCAQRWDK